jgi:hypothetical protein
MKQKLPKDQRKALRFAYEIMRGENSSLYIPYIHGIVLHRINGKLLLRSGAWIEPDQDSEKPYLNESTFTHLTMQGYFECQHFLPGPKWFYRLTRHGCAAMGWTWPYETFLHQNGHVPPIARLQQQEEFHHQRNARNSRHNFGSDTQQKYYFPHKHMLYHRHHK